MSIFPIGAKVGADTSAFVSSMGAATLGLKAFTGGAALAGAAIGVGLALAIGTSVNAAREFQVELVKLNTLVGIQVEQIQEWEGSIKDLAVETGRMPADLTRAMFAITSGGARGQEALDLLEQAAKGSALGLGDMTSIGRTATAMLQAFGDEGLTAEKSIDVLLLTMRQGNLEAGGLAAAFSRVLGPAKSLGSSVEEIGAFLGTFTRLGGSTEEAATGLVNVFTLLIKTPKDVRDSMEAMGFSIEEVRATLAADGLPAALQLMKEGIGDNVDVLGDMIPNVRALIGFLNTAGLQADSFAADLEIMRNGLGATNEAFEIWGDSAEAVFTQFTAQIKVFAISVGELFLPPMTAVLKVLTDWLGKMDDVAEKMEEVFGQPIDAAVVALDNFAGAVGRMDASTLQRQLDFLPGTIRDAADEAGRLREEVQRLDALPLRFSKEDTGGEVRSQQTIVDAFKARDAIDALNVTRDLQAAKLELVKEALAALQETEEEGAAARKKIVVLSQEELDALAERQEAIQGIVRTLQDELLVLREGEAALIDKQLVELEATPITRIVIALLLEEVEAEKELAEATRETAREKEKASKAEERRLETLKAKRKREAAARTRALERADLARLNAEMQETKRIAQDMANSIGDAFDSIIDGTAGVADAFETMVTEILRQIQRLLIQRAIVEPIINAIAGQFGPSIPQTGGSVGEIISDSLPDAVSGTAAGIAGPSFGGQTVIVQQTIEIHNDMIDQQSGDAFMVKHAPRIARIIAEGVRESGDLAEALRR